MSEEELLKALEESEKPKPPETIKEIRKENYDSDKIIRDLRALYESNENYNKPKRINGDHKDEWKIQLKMEIGFISIKDFRETISIYFKSKNITILTGYETDDIIEKLFDSFLEKYQEGLKKKKK